jgi:predicted DNA-binding transcriptional regulator AlpA
MAKRRLLYFRDLKPEKGIPLARASVDRAEKRGRFPTRVRIGPQRVAWFEDEIDAWLAALPRGFGTEQPEPAGGAP